MSKVDDSIKKALERLNAEVKRLEASVGRLDGLNAEVKRLEASVGRLDGLNTSMESLGSSFGKLEDSVRTLRQDVRNIRVTRVPYGRPKHFVSAIEFHSPTTPTRRIQGYFG